MCQTSWQMMNEPSQGTLTAETFIFISINLQKNKTCHFNMMKNHECNSRLTDAANFPVELK